MTVYRTRDLPRGELRGKFVVASEALVRAHQMLPTFRGADGDHEGIGFLLGIETPDCTVLTTFVAPRADHGPGHVMSSREDVLKVVQWAHAHRLALLAQVHSHPGGCTWHSDGDDDMVLMPFEGMLSIVVPNYARARLTPMDSLGVHQFQDRRWTLMDPESVRAGVSVVPGGMDLR